MRIGYLTSLYARGTDSFIRGEVLRLRELGLDVRTYSIRKPAASEATDESIAAEQRQTYYLLEQGTVHLILAVLGAVCRWPGSAVSAFILALRTAQPGVRGWWLAVVYWLEAAVIAKVLQRDGISHLHNHIGQNSATVAMLASAICGVPYSLTIHGPLEFDRPRELAIGEKVRRSCFSVAISEYGRSQLMRWTPRSAWPQIRVVRCGVQPEFLDRPVEHPPSARRPKFVCVGRLAEQKGIPVLIEAAIALKSEGHDFELVLIGDGPLRGEIETLVRESGLGGAFRLAGLLSPADVRREMVSARALVMPSFAEGLPVVMMESLALGRPVIGTYIAGIPELVQPGRTGWLVPAGSSCLLAAAMRQAMEANVDLLVEMGRSGADLVRREHDQRLQARKLADLLRWSSHETEITA